MLAGITPPVSANRPERDKVMKTLKTSIEYEIPTNMDGGQDIVTGERVERDGGAFVEFEAEYVQYESVEEAVSKLGDDKVLQTINRMVKLDHTNPARENAKSSNGHSKRPVMTAEQKESAKQERKANKSFLDALKAKAAASGQSIEDVLASL